ncbi:MAG: hypothetical protein ABJN62_19365 [Halioglobus sp.]
MIALGHCIDFIEHPELGGARSSTLPVIQVRLAEHPGWLRDFKTTAAWASASGRRTRYHYLGQRPESYSDAAAWALEVEDTMTLQWRPGAGLLEYVCGRLFSPERLRFWVLHTWLPLVANLERGLDILHASAVVIDGKAHVFSAPSGGGKTTLASHLASLGHGFLADDSLGLSQRNGHWMATPSHPFLRSQREPESLGEPIATAVQSPVELGALFYLKLQPPETPLEAAPQSGVEKVASIQGMRFVRSPFLKREQFESSAAMARDIDVYTLQIPRGPEGLNKVEAFLKQLR